MTALRAISFRNSFWCLATSSSLIWKGEALRLNAAFEAGGSASGPRRGGEARGPCSGAWGLAGQAAAGDGRGDSARGGRDAAAACPAGWGGAGAPTLLLLLLGVDVTHGVTFSRNVMRQGRLFCTLTQLCTPPIWKELHAAGGASGPRRGGEARGPCSGAWGLAGQAAAGDGRGDSARGGRDAAAACPAGWGGAPTLLLGVDVMQGFTFLAGRH